MNPWIRVLLVFVVAVAAAALLKLLPPIVVLVALVGAVGATSLRLKREAKRESAMFRSEVVGLRLEKRDPFGLLAYPFTLFGRTGRAEVENVRWGSWHGLEVKRFDLSCAPKDDGQRVRLACAIAPAVFAVLPVIVEATRLAGLLDGSAIDEVVVEGLPDGWVVRCDDQAMAAALIGPSVTTWLRELDEPWGFEVNGSLAVAYGPPSPGVEEALERLEAYGRLLDEPRERRAAETPVPERPDTSV